MLWVQRPVLGFGSTLSLKLAHRDKAHAEHALDLAVADIRHIEAEMSLFSPSSALSQLNARGYLLNPDPVLLDILTKAQAISKTSQGAFDVTVQPLWTAFAAAQASGQLPTPAQVSQARRHVGWQFVQISPQAIRFTRPHMAITLNGIAQGYAADLVKSRWQCMSIEQALINTGEWAALGQAPEQAQWQLGIANPRDEQHLLKTIAMQGKSVAPSSDAQTYFSPDLKHHTFLIPTATIHPRTSPA